MSLLTEGEWIMLTVSEGNWQPLRRRRTIYARHSNMVNLPFARATKSPLPLRTANRIE